MKINKKSSIQPRLYTNMWESTKMYETRFGGGNVTTGLKEVKILIIKSVPIISPDLVT